MTHIELKTQELSSKSSLNNVENVVTMSLASKAENAHTSLQCSITNTVSIDTMPVTTPIATTISSDSVTSVEQTLSSMSLYTATTTAMTFSYIYISGPPLLIPTSSNVASQSLPTLHYQNLYEPVLTSTLSHRDTYEPGVPLVATCTIHEITHGTQQFATSGLPKLSENPLEWQSFWESFSTAIHLNPNLRGVQKFNYLKAPAPGRCIENNSRPSPDSLIISIQFLCFMNDLDKPIN